MILLYSIYWIVVSLASLTLHFLSLLGDKRSKAFLAMRRSLPALRFKTSQSTSAWAWFHCASLGEYEQAAPVIEAYIARHPKTPILLTLFSPSAHTPLSHTHPSWLRPSDIITGLPLDSPFHIRAFLNTLSQDIKFFASAKYEVWPELIRQLSSRDIPTFVFAAHLTPSAPLLRKTVSGWFLRKVWSKLTSIFTQDSTSSALLKTCEIASTPLGDPRADRVLQLAAAISPPASLLKWKADAKVIVAGSTYHAEELPLSTLSWSNDTKLILAPHEVDTPHINKILSLFNATSHKTIASTLSAGNLSTPVLIVDSIGLLTSLYPLADLAVVGGGYGKGIHNILEPAAHNISIITGPNTGRFREASELIADGALVVAEKPMDLASAVWRELPNPQPSGKWLASQSGSSEKIASHLP